MAELCRVTKLHDAEQNQTLTFLLPPAISVVAANDEIASRRFPFAGHRWRLNLSSKNDRHLSAFLVCCDLSPQTRCTVDFTITLINRESYTQNESFTEKDRYFERKSPQGVPNSDCLRHGRQAFITLDDLLNRKFADSRGEYILELNMRNPRTVFTHCYRLNDDQSIIDDHSTVFFYGDMEWQCIFYMIHRQKWSLKIVRKNKIDNLCKLDYEIVIDSIDNRRRRSEIFDFDGQSRSSNKSSTFLFDGKIFNSENPLKLEINLHKLTLINHVTLEKSIPSATFKDSDKQTWQLAINNSIQNLDYVILNLKYIDYHNIPKNYLRYVTWSAKIFDSDSSSYKDDHVTIKFENFYSRLYIDSGQSIEFKNQIPDRFTVEIEFFDSNLLYNAVYNHNDDIYRKHIGQMRREIYASQVENNDLGQELRKYQSTRSVLVGNRSQSLGYAHRVIYNLRDSNNICSMDR